MTFTLKNRETFVDTGNAVVGANVVLYVASDTHPNPNVAVASTTTDGNGNWQFTGLTDATQYDVTVTYNNVTKTYTGLSQAQLYKPAINDFSAAQHTHAAAASGGLVSVPAYVAITFPAGSVFQVGTITYTVLSSRYWRHGNFVHWQLNLLFTAGVPGTAGTAITLTLPTGIQLPAAVAGAGPVGTFIYYDAGVRYVGNIESVSATVVSFFVHNATTGLGATPNFGIATNDQLYFNFISEVV